MFLELGFVLGGLLLYVAIPSKWKEIFWVNLIILLPVMGWMLYSQITSGYTHNQLGLRTDDWLAGFSLTFSFFVVAIGSMAMYGGNNDQLVWNRNMTISVFLYPVWGAAQQFLFNSYLTVRLVDLGVPPLVVALIVGIAFMLIHYPNRWLMPATFVLGFVGSLFFQHEPNIWLLGFLHGWLGIPYYYWVMGRDPIAEKFAKKT